MYDIEKIKGHIKEHLKESRFIHTLGVVETAVALARLNDVSEEKALVAALLHDVAKNMTINDMKKIINENKIELSFEEEQSPELWHSMVAPIISRKVFNIEDEEILSAMRWHTTGKEGMSKLDKIIYVADMIEPNRKFPGVESLRKETFRNLDEGLIMAMTHTIKYLLDMGLAIDINSIKARNYMILNRS
ncbi:bis(5'-nucleosyl)-tetraphosphatase (symmetrical) YqeK [Clostridium sp.]|uniref:bis(5'-nucleosyl)-tetraphosphatase (symmetrical) YqeK n=1 Tax=Clostridium sp. TaxID=1506 RepID=UPI003F3F0426